MDFFRRSASEALYRTREIQESWETQVAQSMDQYAGSVVQALGTDEPLKPGWENFEDAYYHDGID